jgi:uncharacterized membrane protein YhaH (DUF805 family)
MDAIPFFIAAAYGFIGLLVFVALIYLIVKRIDDKQREDFEKRSN